MKDRIVSALKRVQRYNFEDGTGELLIGGLFFWAGVFHKPLPVPDCPAGFSIVGLILTVFLVERLRQCYVYPRSGYVKTVSIPGTATRKRVLLLLGLLIGLITLVLILSPIFLTWGNGDAGLSWLTFTIGLAFSLLFAFQGFRLGFPRLIIVALISSGLAILLSPFMLSNQTYYFSTGQFPYWVVPAWQIFFSMYFLFMALVMIISGGMAFLNYLRRNPLLEDSPNE